jgi:hypothetical protein
MPQEQPQQQQPLPRQQQKPPQDQQQYTPSFDTMASDPAQIGLIELEQMSDSELKLANKAMLWRSQELNQHLQLLVHLPSGITIENLKGYIISQGTQLQLRFPRGSFLFNTKTFEDLIYKYYAKKNITPNIMPFTIGKWNPVKSGMLSRQCQS